MHLLYCGLLLFFSGPLSLELSEVSCHVNDLHIHIHIHNHITIHPPPMPAKLRFIIIIISDGLVSQSTGELHSLLKIAPVAAGVATVASPNLKQTQCLYAVPPNRNSRPALHRGDTWGNPSPLSLDEAHVLCHLCLAVAR